MYISVGSGGGGTAFGSYRLAAFSCGYLCFLIVFALYAGGGLIIPSISSTSLASGPTVELTDKSGAPFTTLKPRGSLRARGRTTGKVLRAVFSLSLLTTIHTAQSSVLFKIPYPCLLDSRDRLGNSGGN